MEKLTMPMTHEQFVAAKKKGDSFFSLTYDKQVPIAWFGGRLAGKKMVCIACAGGTVGPMFAALGVGTTVFDTSEELLREEQAIAKREKVCIDTEPGALHDMSELLDARYELIWFPTHGRAEALAPIYAECNRLLRKGGGLLLGFTLGEKGIEEQLGYLLKAGFVMVDLYEEGDRFAVRAMKF